MRQRDVLAILLYIQCAVYAVPFRHRAIFDPLALDPLKSTASEIFGPAGGAGTDSSPSTSRPATSNTVQSTTAGTQTNSAQSNLSSGASTATISDGGTESIAASSTATQLSTGGVSPTTTASPASGSLESTADPSAGFFTTTSASGTGSMVVPTSPGSNDPPGSGSGSDSGSGSASSSDSSNSSGGLSPGEIAAAVILPVLAVLALLLLCFFCAPARRRFNDWRQQRMERKEYRRALDDPVLAFGMRQRGAGLGLGDVQQLMRPLSFGFRNPPRQYPSIKRKPLNWNGNVLGSADDPAAIGMAIPMPNGTAERHRTRTGSVVSDISEATEEDVEGGPGYQDARSTQASPEDLIR